MRKFGIALIIGLLLVSGVVAAMAYTSAEVTNEALLTVTNTNNSLLALRATTQAPGLKDGTAYYENGELKFKFHKGLAGSHGLQPNSWYEWQKLFHVFNQSNSAIAVTVEVVGPMVPYVFVGLDNAESWGPSAAYATSVTFNLPSGHSKNVDVKAIIPSGTSLASFGDSIVVTAVALD